MNSNFNSNFNLNTDVTYKFSNQAIGSLLLTLQKCLSEQMDITELLEEWRLELKDGEVWVTNPPSYKVPGTETVTERLE